MALKLRPQSISPDGKFLIDESGAKYAFTGDKPLFHDNAIAGKVMTLSPKTAISLGKNCIKNTDEITIRFWACPADLKQDCWLVQSVTNSKKGLVHQIGIFLPYGPPPKGVVYFDCVVFGTKYADRIDKAYTTDDLAPDRWSHWTFTKDVKKGEMKIYRNGLLWHNNDPKKKTVLPILLGNPVTIGSASDPTTPGFHGGLAQFEILDEALSDKQIAAHFSKLTAHPIYAVRPKDVSDDNKFLIDQSGVKYPIVGKGIPTTAVSTVAGPCVQLDGFTAIKLDPKAVAATDGFTASFWACPANLTQKPWTIQGTANKSTIRAPGIFIPYLDKKAVVATFDFPLDGKKLNDRLNRGIGPKGIAVDKWAHWTFTKDVAKGEMKMFRNGEPWKTPEKLKQPIVLPDTLSIGNSLKASAGNTSFAGSLAQIEFYYRALADAEVAVEYSRNGLKPFVLRPEKITGQTLLGKKKQKFPIIDTPPSLQPSGVLGKSVVFGQKPREFGYVQLPAKSILPGNHLTVAFWTKPASDDQTNLVVKAVVKQQKDTGVEDSADNLAFDIQMPWASGDGVDKFLVFRCGNDGQNVDQVKFSITDADLAVDQWTHWAFVKDGTALQMRIYRNGMLWPTEKSIEENKMKPMPQPGLIMLGSNSNNSTSFRGEIAQFMMIGKTLSRDEIITLMIDPITSQKSDKSGSGKEIS